MQNEVFSYTQKSAKAKIYTIMALVALADFLFYNHAIGWTAGFFGALLIVFYALYNPVNTKLPMTYIIIALTLAQCLVLIEKQSGLSFCLMSLGLISLSLVNRDDWKHDAALWVRYSFSWLIRFGYPLRRLNKASRKYKSRYAPPNAMIVFIRGWFLPVLLSGMFLFLFAQANPIIQNWFKDFDLTWFFKGFSIWRPIFLLGMAALICSVIRPRLKIRIKRKKQPSYYKKREEISLTQWAFTKEAVLRSLVIFNMMFAVQTLMDLNYLWAGSNLPKGFSYAQYAHDGAYPLIVTALLAALFVLITQGSDQVISGSSTIQKLTYIWVAQNILLVFSAIYRTALYVEIYALTYWRVAAFIWMGLVAAGLFWIILRGALGKSNRWLINANVLTLLATLYVTSLVNIGGYIAHYNVAHAREISGKGVSVDLVYLKQIGSASIPALEKLLETGDIRVAMAMGDLEKKLKHNMDDWRRWTYSENRMSKYLEKRMEDYAHKGWTFRQVE